MCVPVHVHVRACVCVSQDCKDPGFFKGGWGGRGRVSVGSLQKEGGNHLHGAI